MGSNEISPDEAFALLGNEIRVAIIQALGEAKGEPLTFSKLRNQVGTTDSGQFNYHLDKLVGPFLKRTDGGGYELTYAGKQVVGAILSGEFNRRGEMRTFTLESDCVTCETPVEATYEDEWLEVRCPSCDEIKTRFGFPPGGFEDRSLEELSRTFDNWIRGILQFTTGGICYNCSGKTTGRLTADYNPVHEKDPVHVEFSCQRCNDSVTMTVNSFLMDHPAVTAFHYDHGINVNEGEFWNIDFIGNRNLNILRDDPLLVESVLELDGDQITFTVDNELSVHTS